MSDPGKTKCQSCEADVPAGEIDEDGKCLICREIVSLRRTMEKTGAIHPDLFDRTYRAPHNDP